MKVVSNTAVSLDGRINTRERRFTFFGSARDHARMSRLRSDADAVRRLQLVASEVEGDEIFLHYRNLRGAAT